MCIYLHIYIYIYIYTRIHPVQFLYIMMPICFCGFLCMIQMGVCFVFMWTSIWGRHFFSIDQSICEAQCHHPMGTV